MTHLIILKIIVKKEAAKNDEPLLEQFQIPMETDPPSVVPGPVQVNNGEIGINIVEDSVTNGDDKWSLVVCVAMFLFSPISPFITYFFKINENNRFFSLIKSCQKFFAIIAFVFITYSAYKIIYNVINVTKPYGRAFWINLYILTMSITVLATIIILWARQNDLRYLVLSHKVVQLSPIKIDLAKDKFCALFKTAILYLFLMVYHVVNKFTYDDNLYVDKVHSFLVYVGYNNVFIIYIVLCWMMCARFRHLNLSVKSLTNKILGGQGGIRADKHHLQQIANWYVDEFTRSICIETMLELNDISCSLGTK
jgi:hypothetical protein